jgi:hypothetical protein
VSGNKESGKKAYQTMLKNMGEEGIRNFHSSGGKASNVGNYGNTNKDENGLTGRERARIASINYHKSKNHNIGTLDEE